MLRKLLYIVMVLACVGASAQKKKKKTNILQSTDIAEIENFLKTAHPDDPKRQVLKPKLIALKNKAWTEGKKNAKPMEARPIIIDIPKGIIGKGNSEEAEEFKKLIAETSNQHSEKTVKLLNALFDNDITSKEAIILVQNNSDCNMIMRINGKEFYNLAVPTHGENTLVLKKGEYNVTSNVCGIKYQRNFNVQKSMVIILNTPVVAEPEKK